MKTKDITRTAILTAVIFVCMSIIRIPLYDSNMHIGAFVIVIVCLSFERKQAIFSTCLATLMYDILYGFIIYIPFTLVARLLMASIICMAKDKSIMMKILYTILASFLVVVVYFISFYIFTGNLYSSVINSTADLIQIIFNVLAIFIAIPVRNIVEYKIK